MPNPKVTEKSSSQRVDKTNGQTVPGIRLAQLANSGVDFQGTVKFSNGIVADIKMSQQHGVYSNNDITIDVDNLRVEKPKIVNDIPFTPYREEVHEHIPDKWDKLEKGGFVERLVYGILDDFYISAQVFTCQLDRRHLSGGSANSHEVTSAGLSSMVTIFTMGAGGGKAIGSSGKKIMESTRNVKIPIYRVYGGKSSIGGISYTVFNPKYVPYYRKVAGLPKENSGEFLLRGKIEIKNLNLGKWFASPLDGNPGGLPLEFYQNYDQLVNPVNIIIKKPF